VLTQRGLQQQHVPASPARPWAPDSASAPSNSFVLGASNYSSLASVIDRDSVVNLALRHPHKNGTKDDIQLLGMVNYINNSTTTRPTTSAAPRMRTTSGSAPRLRGRFYVDGYQGQTPRPASRCRRTKTPSQPLAGPYYFPRAAHTFSTSGNGFRGAHPRSTSATGRERPRRSTRSSGPTT